MLMKSQKKQLQSQSQKKQVNKTALEQKIETIKNLYDSFPNYIDKSTKDLLIKYNL